MRRFCLLKYGVVSGLKPGYAQVNFTEDKFPSAWLPIVVRKTKTDKESWQLEVNEHVVCLMDKRCNEGVIIGAIPSTVDVPDSGEAAGLFRKLFSDGTLIEYNKNNHTLTVDVKGKITGKATGNITVESGAELKATAASSASIEAPSIIAKATTSAELEAPTITLKGNVTVTGGLTAATIATSGGGAITSSGSMTIGGTITGGEVQVGAIKLSSHKHSGVQTGGGSSGTPVP